MIYQNKDLLEGKRISQRFRIKSVEQWREHAVFCTADDLEKNRQVSIVLVDPLAVKSPEAFEKIAKRKQRLKHANLVSLEDFGSTGEGEPYIALDRIGLSEFQPGVGKKASRSISGSVEIISQLIDALLFLSENHELPLLPLPDRILIREEGSLTVKILDLNFAEAVAEPELFHQGPLSPIQATRYTPPECIKGKAPDARSQLYSLGCLLYQLLTGVFPFESDDLVELQSQQLCVNPKRFHEARPDLYLPPALEACVFKSLSKEPAQRPASLRQFQIDLHNAVRVQPWWQKKWRQVACLTGLFVAAAVYVSGSVVQPFWIPANPPEVVPSHPEIQLPQVSDGASSILPPVPKDAIKLGKFILSGSTEKKLGAGNYQCEELCLSDSAKLIFEGNVGLWITPSESTSGLTISGMAQLASSAQPANLKIYYFGNKNIVMAGDAKLKAEVLAPSAILDASGNSTIEGPFTSAGQKLTEKAHFAGESE